MVTDTEFIHESIRQGCVTLADGEFLIDRLVKYVGNGRIRWHAAGASEIERRLIEALASRFQKPHKVRPQDFERWDDAYAAAMRRVYHDFPDDHACSLPSIGQRCGPPTRCAA